MTPTAIACRKGVTEQGKEYIHTDVYLEYRARPPGNLPGVMTVRTGMTVSLPRELLKELGGYAFKYWLDWVTAALLESEAADAATIERFYQDLGAPRWTEEGP